ncbi:hypothetical protein GCM10022251_59250 [Phytohabitans flavus]|uniref:Uncharacterized protein n=1 Tax=Phytohabitans flavus TaxID=1076124 RepID=A0A6F8XXM0_9ACTN|nr:hypothetical protein Pflav_049960 [Phytohabitans flavus]
MTSNTINVYANAIGMVAVSPLDAKPVVVPNPLAGCIDGGHRRLTKDSGSGSGRAGPYRPHIRCEPAPTGQHDDMNHRPPLTQRATTGWAGAPTSLTSANVLRPKNVLRGRQEAAGWREYRPGPL